MFRPFAVLALCFSLLPALAMADPPARVGRLAYIENGVNFRVDRNNPGEEASINWPISSGAELETERRGRAEVWVGSSAFRLDGNSRVEFVTVDDRQIAVQLHEGRLAISILDRDQADDISVLTPDGPIRFTAPGRYRIDLQRDHSELSVQAGQARVDNRGQRLLVAAGQTARLYAEAPVGLEFAADQDAFDRWVAERENATLASASRRHVSPQMTGYQDLDAHGDWRSAPEYGSVWYPRIVADDWAPYRFGRWAWVAPWGWTWIDQAPWRFAPLHDGRWVIIRGRWAWVPGRYEARPVYAPALVGWIGNGGWSLSFGFGTAPAVGWFPLAPREVYVPTYRYSPTYVRQLNITHVHDVKVIDRAVRAGPHESHAYRERPQAVTVVPSKLLHEGRPIGRNEMRQPERRELERAPQIRQPPAAPRREMREETRQPAVPFEQRERPREMRSMPEAQRQERVAPREMPPQIAPPPRPARIEPPRGPERENPRQQERRGDREERGGKRE